MILTSAASVKMLHLHMQCCPERDRAARVCADHALERPPIGAEAGDDPVDVRGLRTRTGTAGMPALNEEVQLGVRRDEANRP